MNGEVRDAGEDLQNETAGAMELTVDYGAHKDSCHTYVHTQLERDRCVERKMYHSTKTAHPWRCDLLTSRTVSCLCFFVRIGFEGVMWFVFCFVFYFSQCICLHQMAVLCKSVYSQIFIPSSLLLLLGARTAI